MNATAEVRSTVLAYLGDALDAKGLRPEQVGDDLDLLAEGMVDSFGLLELIGRIEEEFSVSLDFDDVEPEVLTVLGPFCDYVDSQLSSGRVASRPQASEPVEQPEAAQISHPTLPADRPTRRPRRVLGRAAAGAYRELVRARDKLFSLSVAGSFASFGASSVLQLPVRLKNEHRIAVGSNVFVAAGSWLQVLDGDGDEPAIVLGDRSSLAGGCVLSAAASITLGREASMARNVYVADHSHVYDDPDASILEQGVTRVEPIEIGDGAWIGENAIVLPGVRIGTRAVVSANSVVSHDVPDYSVVAGHPARVVRRFGGAG